MRWRQDDRVFVVVALPRHERDEQVLAQRHLAAVGAGTVGDDLAGLDPNALIDDGLLVEAGALVRPAELVQPVGAVGAVVVHHRDVVGGGLFDHTGLLRDDDVAGVLGRAGLHAGADQRRLAAQQRDGLALHVGAHQGPVGLVVLQERDHRGGDRNGLPRGNVHVLDLGRRDLIDLAGTLAAHQHPVLGEPALAIQLGAGLGDDEAVLLVRGQVLDVVTGDAVVDLAVRGLDEPERVHPGEGGERADQADVRAFRGLDRAHPAVVGRVHVADLERGAITGQTARPERRQPALVGQPGERVGLVHELGQLAGAEELLDGGDDGPDVDQGLRRDGLDVLGGHPLADDPLHPGQPDPDLVLDQLADGTQPTVTEVIDVVGLDRALLAHAVGPLLVALVQAQEVLNGGQQVVLGQRADLGRLVDAQLLVDLVPADLGQVVALVLEEQVVQQGLRALLCGGLARTQLAVDIQQRLVLAADVVLLQGRQQHR